MGTKRLRVGDRVRVERDESRWPSKGSWPRYRGKTGTVIVASNYGEVGVDLNHQQKVTAWFLPHELTVERPAGVPQRRYVERSAAVEGSSATALPPGRSRRSTGRESVTRAGCEVCGAAMIGRRRQARFCSPACRVRGHRGGVPHASVQRPVDRSQSDASREGR